jgi:hypothetical protein
MTSSIKSNVLPNPMASSPNKMKLGVFAINAHGGCAITTAPEVHRADNWQTNLETGVRPFYDVAKAHAALCSSSI